MTEDGRFIYKLTATSHGRRLVKKRLKRSEVIVRLPADPALAQAQLDWARERGITLIAAGANRHGHFPQACRNSHWIDSPDDLREQGRLWCRHCHQQRNARHRIADRLRRAMAS